MSLEECLREQTLNHLSETCAHQWQEHSRDHNVIPRLGHSSDLTPAHDGHAARNVAHGHLVAVLLHFDLLELDELGATGLQIQTTTRFVHSAIIRRAIVHGREG